MRNVGGLREHGGQGRLPGGVVPELRGKRGHSLDPKAGGALQVQCSVGSHGLAENPERFQGTCSLKPLGRV